MAEKWIQKAIKKPGALKRQLGVPEGEKIPASKLAAARAGEHGPLAEKRAHLAKTLASLHHSAGTIQTPGKSNDPDESLRKGNLPKAEAVKEAKCEEGAALKAVKPQIESNNPRKVEVE